MKQLLGPLLSLLFVVPAQAQLPDTTRIDMTGVEARQKVSIPFSAVQVLDVRFDRTNIGCVGYIRKANSSVIKSRQTVAVFPDSLKTYLPQILLELFQFQKDTSDTLVLMVKQFHLSERFYNPINLEMEPEFLLRLSFSAFAKRNQTLAKLFSVDDLLSKKIPDDRALKDERVSELRKDLLMQIFEETFQNKHWQGSNTAFDASAVQQGIQQRFQLPLLTDHALKTGLYTSFREFKKNSPAVTNVQITEKNGEITSIQDAAGKEIAIAKYWGVCTGGKQYLVFRGDLYRLIRSDNSFYFSSYITDSDLSGLPSFGDYAPQTGLLPATIKKLRDSKRTKHVFYLNMDDENIHLEELFGKSPLKQMQKELLK